MIVKERILVIHRSQEFNWRSCQTISSNLLFSYQLIENYDLILFSVEDQINRYTALKIINLIKLNAIFKIIWLDHKPHLASFLIFLCKMENESFIKQLQINLHVYGDFVLDSHYWIDLKSYTSFLNLRFIIASERQKGLICNLFGEELDTMVIPFSVDEDFYTFNAIENERRSKLRTNLGLGNEKIYLYTGRASYQKNIDLLIKCFERFKLHSTNHSKLLIVGPWDDILMPYFGKSGIIGSYSNYYLKMNPLENNKDIYFINSKKREDLKDYYLIADAFISLSTYNDEDFGMSPAEALLTGLPCMLSDWGGYDSFKHCHADIFFIDVDKTKSIPKPMIGKAKYFFENIEKMETIKNRVNRSSGAQEYLSRLSVAKKLKSSLDNHVKIKFKLNEHFIEISKRFKNNPTQPLDEILYRELYGEY